MTPLLIRRTRYELHSLLSGRPGLYLPAARLERTLRRDRHPFSPRPFVPGTELVLEGYPRSGNTFAVAAFLSAQPRPVALAHHLHAPAQVVAAIRRGVPALVLFRDPADAVVSLVIRAPFITLVQALRSYGRFHRALLPHRGRFVAASFREVIDDFGAVIERLNSESGRAFTPFLHSEENVRSCFAAIEERNRRVSGGRVSESSIARPSVAREPLTAELRRQLRRPDLAPRVEQCRQLLRQLCPQSAEGPA